MDSRVTLFFDGYNFTKRLREFSMTLRVDYAQLASWLVAAVAGDSGVYTGANYYIGCRKPEDTNDPEHRFLTFLSYRVGYFVHREPLFLRENPCKTCGAKNYILTEKRVDVRLASDMIHFAAVNAYDVAVLLSGDQDFIPAVEAVHRLGKKVYLATLRPKNVSPELRQRCFGEINLADGVEHFRLATQESSTRNSVTPEVAIDEIGLSTGSTLSLRTTTEPVHVEPTQNGALSDTDLRALVDGVHADLRQAWNYFSTKGRYLSKWYFCNKWRTSNSSPAGAREREIVLETLEELGHIELYPELNARGKEDEAIRILTESVDIIEK